MKRRIFGEKRMPQFFVETSFSLLFKREYDLTLIVQHKLAVKALTRALREEAANGRGRTCREKAHNFVL